MEDDATKLHALLHRMYEAEPEWPINIAYLTSWGKVELPSQQPVYLGAPIFSEVRAICEAEGHDDVTLHVVSNERYGEMIRGMELTTYAPEGDERIIDPADERQKAHDFYKDK